MVDFSKEVMAYSLQNAIEFGKADKNKILPKLFKQGMKREDIPKVLPIVEEAVKEVNSMSKDELKKNYETLKKYVHKNEEKKEGLAELSKSAIKGKPVFRVAPFPSGALHIGNAKTFLINSLYSEKYSGKTILVMDDTIGSPEKPLNKDAYELIEEGFKWLDVKYSRPIIYKSKRMKLYYKYAEKLIEKNKAYVCHCTIEELRENRAKGVECGCRHFPPGLQLARWKEMFNMVEGHSVLRIKTNMKHPNPAFRDRVLFKISDRKHVLVKNKYRVWPTLEMSWAVDDHELGITHIIRGNDLMIETDMEKYIWDIFRWKHPQINHTGLIRHDGIGAKISKSKAQKEVESGEFIGWDDPRTWSIQSLARRGILKESIREFVKSMGLNKQDITVPIETLYSINRKLIDKDSDRYSFVPDSVEIKLDKTFHSKEIEVPIHPEKKETKLVKVSKIYISKNDLEKYQGEEVRLLHLFNVKLKKKSNITSVENKKIPKINWVSEKVPAKILMPNGTWVKGFAESGVKKLKVGSLIQFERFGFVRYDGRSKDTYKFWFAHK
jgi:glutamyl-tRNA synthetase